MKIKALVTKRNALNEDMKKIAADAEASEGGIMTEDQRKTFEEKKTKKAEIQAQIDLMADVNFDDSGDDDTTGAEAAANTSKSSNTKKKGQIETLDQFMTVALENPNDSRLDEFRAEQRMDTGSTGGIMIPSQFRTEIMSEDPEISLIRSRANVIPAGNPPDGEVIIPALEDGNDVSGNPIFFGGVQVFKVSEGGLKPETGFKLRGISLKPEEMAAIIPFTDKLLRNWQAATGWASKLLSGSVAAFSDYQYLWGNGVGGPDGLCLSPARILIARANANRIQWADCAKMIAAFRGDMGNAVWAVSYSGFGDMLRMVGDGGGATNTIQWAGGTPSLMGIPIVRHSYMKALGSLGDLALIDASKYLIKDGSGPIIETGFADGQWQSNKRSIKITFNTSGKPWKETTFKDASGFESSFVVVLNVP